ncbi:MAG TPA: hypothetical protein VFN91_01150 [Myxococcaceae bacterium]|nr:hypothetical protein [Myxococcaceae bacterium]
MSRQRSFPVAGVRSFVLGGVLLALLGGVAARASEPEPLLPSSRDWYAGIATGWYFPIERPSSPYSLGGGGILLLGHQLSSRVSLRLEINMSLLGGDPHDTWSLRVTPEVKWDLFGGRLTPFLWTGAGLAYAAVYPGPDSAATLVIPVGVGIQWDLDSRTRLFVQANYDILPKHLSVQSIPLVGGFEVHF